MGNKTQTATTAQTSTPVNSAALQQIYGQVANAAQTPYTPYNGQLVAPVNAQQTAGINNINTAANQAQPYYTQAAGLASSAANPLTAAQIQQYQNPYTQNVVNATQAQLNDLNAQQQNNIKGNAASAGALGGDRQAVAQAQLAGQQALNESPTIANLYANSYNSGLQTAGQQFQQNPLAAASSIAGIGAGAQNAALTGAGAQINAGTLQQQTQQAADTANYGQYQAAQGFPYQSAAFLEQYGLPAALGQGTTSYGNQQTQGPTNLAPYLGAGIAGAGLFLKDGGEVEGYAPGGGVGYITSPQGYILGNQGYIPNTSPAQNSFQAPSLSYLKPSSQSSTANPFNGTGSGGISGTGLQNNFGSASFGGGNVFSDDAWGGDKSNPLPGLSAGDYGYKVGGLVHAIHEIHKTIKRSRGGAVTNTTPFEGFDDGGVPSASFDDRFQPAVDNPFGDLTRGQALMLAAKDGTLAPDTIPGGELPPAPPSPAISPVINPDQPYRLDGTYTGGMNPALQSDASMPGPSGEAPVNPMLAARQAVSLPEDNQPDEQPSSALGYAGNPMQATPPAQPSTSNSDVAPEGHPGLLGLNWSDKTRQALVAAGLGIMASRSPFLGAAIGEGGLQGLKSYSESTKQEQEAANQKFTHDQEAQRLLLQIKQQQETERHNKAVEEKEFKPQLVHHTDPASGQEVYATYDPNTRKMAPVDFPSTGDVKNSGKYVSQAPPVEERRRAPAASPQARDEGYIKWLEDHRPPGYADIVRGVADYEIDPNREASMQKGQRDQLYRDVKLFDPTYDQTHFGEKTNVIRSFSTGQDRQAVNSLNVSVSHLATFQQLADALKNGNVQAINSLGNKISAQFGYTAPTNFDAAKEIVGDEVVKAVVGGVNSQADREGIKHLISSAQTPDQLKGVIQTFTALLGGQLEGRRQGYQAGTGLNNFDQKYLSDETRDALKRVIVTGGKVDPAVTRLVYPSGIPKEAGSAAPAAGGFTPPAGAIPRQFNGKTYYYDPQTKQPYPGQ